jgi:hypothetical protein
MKISPINLPADKVVLIKFEEIFQNIEKDLLNELLLYDLLKDNVLDLRKTDTKKILYHHVIYNICEIVIKYKKTYKSDVCIIYNNIFTNKNEICRYIDCDKLHNQLINILNKIKNNLYIPIFKVKHEITQNNLEYGEVIDIIRIIINTLATNSTKKNNNFLKTKEFVKKNGLIFLDETYFTKIQSHYLLI